MEQRDTKPTNRSGRTADQLAHFTRYAGEEHEQRLAAGMSEEDIKNKATALLFAAYSGIDGVLYHHVVKLSDLPAPPSDLDEFAISYLKSLGISMTDMTRKGYSLKAGIWSEYIVILLYRPSDPAP